MDALLDDVFADDITFPAADGYPLAGSLFLPCGTKRHTVLINSATAVPRKVMQRIAVPMIGGMISSTLLTLIVIPAIFGLVKARGLERDLERDEDSVSHSSSNDVAKAA
jgi:hypothetical protein